ncbi:hypothetical protein AADZ86_17530 [Colwelliaceae bacterium BS250]
MRVFYTITAVIISLVVVALISNDNGGNEPNNRTLNSCDFSSSTCNQTFDLGEVELITKPQLISPETEISFSLNFTSSNAVVIKSAWLEGKNMFMGKIPLFFKKVSSSKALNNTSTAHLEDPILMTAMTFNADTMIGACTEEQMIWKMVVVVEVAGVEQLLFFDFISQS